MLGPQQNPHESVVQHVHGSRHPLHAASGRTPIPKVDVLFSGTFRSDQGAPLAANWTITNTNPPWTRSSQQLGRAAVANSAPTSP